MTRKVWAPASPSAWKADIDEIRLLQVRLLHLPQRESVILRSMKLTQSQLRNLIKEALGEEQAAGQGSGEIKVLLEVTIDAEDLVNEMGPEYAQQVLTDKVGAACEEVSDMLSQAVLDVQGVPVAVRSVKVSGG